MPDTVQQIGSELGFVENPVAGQSLQDPFPNTNLMSMPYRRLAETRQAALSGKNAIALTWNDVLYAHRMVYTKVNQLGSRLPTNLLFAYSPGAKLAYTTAMGGVTGTTDTDVTGKTFTQAQGQIIDGVRIQVANGVSTAPLATGQTDNQVWLMLAHGEPAVAAASIMYARRTDANNWIRFFRQSATNVRIEKDVASATTTERDITIPTTEPISGSAYAIRINGTICQVFVNGTLYDQFTLSAGAQGLTGLQVGFDTTAAARAGMGELEVWSTAAPV